MQRRIILVALLLFNLQFFSLSQPNSAIVAGPMLAQVELRTARIWVEVTPGSRNVQVRFWKKSDPKHFLAKKFPETAGNDFSPLQIEIGGLDINTSYRYVIMVNGALTKAVGEFTTRDLWQYHKPVPDFTFLTGSCAYFNEERYDRKFTDLVRLDKHAMPYGGDSSIFETMAKTPASFMMWLGDNWYTREADFSSEWGLWYRASHDRSLPVIQNFLKAMPHYAIWDDHDYGPDDADKSFPLKEASRRVFMNYWGNPSYGENGRGIYTKLSYADVDFFMMDDRYFRSADDMEPFIGDKPNPDKRMWGAEQLDWLKSALAFSKATFKIIVTGSQTLNPASKVDCLQHYPIEFDALMLYLLQEKIDGVLFLTGDRHHSEVIRYARKGTYSLFDITSSPLTSGVAKVAGAEINNPARVAGTLVQEQNFTQVSISGQLGERMLKVVFSGITGKKLGEWSVNEKELKTLIENK